LLTISFLFAAAVNPDTTYIYVAVITTIFGVGLGFVMQPTLIAAQNTVPKADMGVATSSVTLYRQLGATMGTAIFLSILFGQISVQSAQRFAEVSNNEQFQAALANPENVTTLNQIEQIRTGESALDDSSWIATSDPLLVRPILDGFTDSLSIIFLLAAGLMVLGLIAAYFVPNKEITNTERPV
jgi:hypothetical protein